MAIDSLSKRNSVVSVQSMILPIPDSTIDQGDRQTLSHVYRGILAIPLGVIVSFGGLVKNLVQDLVQPLVKDLSE